MKIAFVNQPWEPVVGPAPQAGSISIWTWEVARRLAGDHEVVVFDRRKNSGDRRETSQENVVYRFVWTGFDERFKRLRERHPRLSSFLRLKHDQRRSASRPMAALGSFYAIYAGQVAAAIRRGGFDVVHVHQSSQFASIIRSVNPRVRLILHMNCEWLTQFDHGLVSRRLRAPDVILGCSDHISGLVKQAFPEVARKCHTVPNGVDIDKFTVQATKPEGATDAVRRTHLLFAGRVSPEKGVHDLLAAFSMVARERRDVQLDLVGEVMSLPMDWIVGLSSDSLVSALEKYYHGHYRTYLEQAIEENQIGDRVTFRGAVPNDRLTSWYQRSDILINPSLSESFGMTVVEAMACGKPAVVTKTGGMKETVVHGTTGLVVAPANPQALAYTILKLVDDRDLCERMGRAGRQRVVDLYSWDKVVQTAYRHYLGKRVPGGLNG